MLRIARLLVIVALVAVPAAALGGEKVVHLDVDGRVSPVRTYASSAPDLLRRVGLDRDDGRVVRPEGKLESGAVVRVRSPKPVHVLTGSGVRTMAIHALTVGEALDELGVGDEERAFLWPPPHAPLIAGTYILLRDAVPVTLTVDGRRRGLMTSAGTVGEVLRQAGVRLGPRDEVVPALDSYPGPETTISVVRVKRVVREERARIPYRHREVRDADLEKGRRVVAQRGMEGLKIRRYVSTVENGRTVSTRLVEEEVVRQPRDEVVKVGTGQPAYKRSGGAGSQEGIASWYRYAGMSAAHRTLPMGTVVRVTNLANGRSVNVVIRDRGPFVQGRVIDLSESAFAELAPLDRGTIRVRVEW